MSETVLWLRVDIPEGFESKAISGVDDIADGLDRILRLIDHNAGVTVLNPNEVRCAAGGGDAA